ncbi:MAG TPA: ROK family protein [Clostridiales bacterium]|nr:ROK family protein [Clostridiales bacterium]
MINENSCCLAIDAGGSYLKAALIKVDGCIVPDSFVKMPIESNGTVDQIKEVYTNTARLGAEKARQHSLNLAGVGVSTPGPFNYIDGISLMKHKYSSIYGIPIRPWIENETGKIPILFLHDSTAFILGATFKGRYSDFKRIAGVIIGTGLGFASMFDSKVYNNPQGGPGISIFARQYREGTAEEYVSRRAIIRQYRNMVPQADEKIDVLDISILARAGNTKAKKVFLDLGSHLAEILHDILFEYKFQCLLLGGAISKSADLFLPLLSQKLADIPSLKLIEQIEDIDNAPLLGAAQALFSKNIK